MKRRILTPAAVLIALSFVPAVANAEQRASSHGGGGGASAPRASAPRSSSTPRASAAPRTYSASAPRTYSAPRAYATPRTYSASRAYSTPRAYASPRPYTSSRVYAGQRGVGVPRVAGGVRVAPRGFATRVIGPRVVVGAPFRSFYRPYYAFRPRFSIGFGLFVGYPVAFPYYAYAYPYPYPYPYPYSYPYSYAPAPYPYSYPAYGYPSYPASTYPDPRGDPNYPPAQGSVGVAPGQQDFGGISFEITPSDAQIYVDDEYMGVVSSFAPTRQPLTLTPGRHHIEVRATGYRTMTFETDVTPGQVIPYQGTLQR